MEVELGGSPIPEVYWYFNEKEIFPGTNNEICLRRLGCHATLIIERVKVIHFILWIQITIISLLFRWNIMDNML